MSVGTEPSRPASEHSSPIEQAMDAGQEARTKAGGRIARELETMKERGAEEGQHLQEDLRTRVQEVGSSTTD